MKKLLFLFLIVVAIASCKSDVDQRPIDDMLIVEYLAANNIIAQKDEDTGVYWRITEEGNGVDYPTINSTIRCFYKGYFLDGSVFDERVEGVDDYLENPLGGQFGLIYGWQVALPKFSKGAKGQIFIPSHAGYGSTDRIGVPKNSVLIFDMHLVNVFN
ncbi:MAG: FKBP-type peptidyl-prolyl cis-trans isomerase FkpA [Saprospiraceae bacterium]|jgi:FKBP-type peptidyl-prolyl cis-trans isomerase FkpA